MGPALPLTINVPEHGSRRLIKDLHAQLRSAIIDGRLKPGLRLPSSRSLAQEWRVSRNCVVAVYDLLLSEGYIRALPRGGTYVADTALRPTERGKALPLDNLQSPLARHWRSKPRIFRFEPSSGFEFDFGVGVPDTSVFPFDWWRRLSARALRAFSRAPGGYAEPEGRQSLREAIARHVSLTRAVACNADDVVVTSGAQQAFNLLARVLVTPGKTVVALEDPGYPPMREAFVSCGAKLAPVPVDSEGIVVERIPHGARIVCVTPSHQFPMGCVMSARRRAALLDFARRRRAVVIEDDYDGEFSHTGRPLDALKTLDTAHCVFYVGTFSKCLFPALRLGFVVVPAWAREAVIAAKQRSDWHGALLSQDALAVFMAEGHLARHVRKMRSVYRERRDVLLHALRQLPGVDVLPAEAGLHVTTLLPRRLNAARIAAAAANDGIRIYSLEWCSISKKRPNGLLWGLGQIATPRVEAGVQRLSRMLR
ncbi:MAG: PLP-dependent aminotransferase family protein [Steroidobacteraceae bacterium]|nr:PLP-dependent aminotransferase family protein [Steroidobacteraceae bacterium]